MLGILHRDTFYFLGCARVGHVGDLFAGVGGGVGWVGDVPTFWVVYKFRGRMACGLFGFGNFRVAAVVSVRGAGVGGFGPALVYPFRFSGSVPVRSRMGAP